MRLVDCIGVVMAELVDDFGDAVVVAFGKSGSDGGLEPEYVVSQYTRMLCANSCDIVLDHAISTPPGRVAQY